MDIAETYTNRTDLLDGFAELGKRIDKSGPRPVRPSKPRASGGRKKQLTDAERTEIVAKYEAGASMVAIMADHHMAKRTVAKVLREAEVSIRPRGGQSSGWR